MLVVARSRYMARRLRRSRVGLGMNMSASSAGGGGAKSAKRSERSNGLDTSLYKNYTWRVMRLDDASETEGKG